MRRYTIKVGAPAESIPFDIAVSNGTVLPGVGLQGYDIELLIGGNVVYFPNAADGYSYDEITDELTFYGPQEDMYIFVYPRSQTPKWVTNANGIHYDGGNVGINTLAPSEMLQLNDGNILLMNTVSVSYVSKLAFSVIGGELGGIRVDSSTGENRWICGPSQFTTFYSNSSEAVRINQSGAVGIGTTNPHASAILDLSSTTRGFSMPRMTESQRLAIPSPGVALMVYQTDNTEGIYVNKSGGWTFVI